MTRIKGKIYSPEEYIAKADDTDPAPQVGFIGLIMTSDKKSSLLYAHPANCQRWVEIELDHIDKIEHLGEQRCGDHRHPLARVIFKPPATPAHATFLSLAHLHHDIALSALIGMGAPALLSGGCPDGQHPCYKDGGWTCCHDLLPVS